MSTAERSYANEDQFSHKPTRTPVEFRIAKTKEDREAVFKFRYKIYVEQMGRDQRTADHKNRMLKDMLDETAIILAAYSDGKVVATGRINFSDNTEFGEEELFGFAAYEAKYPGKLSLTSKMIVDPEFRGSMIFFEMAKKFFEISFERGAVINFIATADHLVRIFERLGFQKYRGRIQWLDYGYSNPMMLDFNNISHLRKIRSPFLHLFASKQVIQKIQFRQPWNWLTRKINSQILTPAVA